MITIESTSWNNPDIYIAVWVNVNNLICFKKWIGPLKPSRKRCVIKVNSGPNDGACGIIKYDATKTSALRVLKGMMPPSVEFFEVSVDDIEYWLSREGATIEWSQH